MTTVYFIRHAEAEGNLYRRIHGHYDSLVTVRGMKQIAQLEKRFESVPIDAVYSSDMFRTKLTAGAVCRPKNLPLHTTPLLREVNMGEWEDRTWGEVERFDPEQYYFFNNDPSRWTTQGTEPFDALQARITEAVKAIAAAHEGQSIAIVTHGSVLRAFAAGVMGVSAQELSRVPHCDNTSVARLTVDNGRMAFEYYGDNSHLPEDLSTFAHQKWWRENTTFDSTNLRFEPFDFNAHTDLYLRYRQDAWEAAGRGSILLKAAKENAQKHSRAVTLALLGDTHAGMVELAVGELEGEKIGSIEFFYMTPQNRRTGIAVQLLGQAISVYRSLGREKVRTSITWNNMQALNFCAKYGFEKVGETMGQGGIHHLLELEIAVPQDVTV